MLFAAGFFAAVFVGAVAGLAETGFALGFVPAGFAAAGFVAAGFVAGLAEPGAGCWWPVLVLFVVCTVVLFTELPVDVVPFSVTTVFFTDVVVVEGLAFNTGAGFT